MATGSAPDVNGLPYMGTRSKSRPRTAPLSPPAFVPKSAPTPKHVNKTKSMNPSMNGTLNINITKGGGQATQAGPKAPPGGDFLSNEDIQKFCEDGRKKARQRAVERSLDAEMLEGRLRNIPDVTGSMSGARARARRVVRWLNRIAQAEKLIAKWYSALYSAFEREYESELMKIGKGRSQQKPGKPFRFR